MNAKYLVGDAAFQLPLSETAGELGGVAVVKLVDVKPPSETENRPAVTWLANVDAVSVAVGVV